MSIYVKYNHLCCCSVKDINNVEIISTEEVGTNDIQAQSKVIVKRPIAKRAGRSISESVSSTVQAGGSQVQMNFRKPMESNQQQMEQTTNGKITSGILYTYNLYLCR